MKACMCGMPNQHATRLAFFETALGPALLSRWWCVRCSSAAGKPAHSSALRRLRPDNTYLLLDDFGESGAEDTGLTTELGVMSNEEEEQRDQQVPLSSPLHTCCKGSIDVLE